MMLMETAAVTIGGSLVLLVCPIRADRPASTNAVAGLSGFRFVLRRWRIQSTACVSQVVRRELLRAAIGNHPQVVKVRGDVGMTHVFGFGCVQHSLGVSYDTEGRCVTSMRARAVCAPWTSDAACCSCSATGLTSELDGVIIGRMLHSFPQEPCKPT